MLRRPLLMTILLFLATVPALAEGGDKVHFGESIVIRQGETANNVVCFGCAVQVQGNVQQNVVVFFGDAAVSGNVEQNVVVFLGDLHLFSRARLGQNAVIMGGRIEATNDVVIGQNRVVFPPLVFFIPILIFAGLLMALISFIRILVHRRQATYVAPQQ